jgi:hypothetical protein
MRINAFISKLFKWGFAAFACGALLFILQGRGSRQNYGYIDPNVYSGLAFKYRELVSELGLNYYATRIWHVLPIQACNFFLEPLAQFFIY